LILLLSLNLYHKKWGLEKNKIKNEFPFPFDPTPTIVPSSILHSRTEAIHRNDSLLQLGLTPAGQISLYGITEIIHGSINFITLFFFSYNIRFSAMTRNRLIHVSNPVSLEQKENIAFSIAKK